MDNINIHPLDLFFLTTSYNYITLYTYLLSLYFYAAQYSSLRSGADEILSNEKLYTQKN